MNRHQVLFFLLIIGFNLLFMSSMQVYPCFGGELRVSIKKKPLIKCVDKETDYLKLIAKSGIGFYKRFISPIGGARCRMKPSCSSYSYEAYAKYGFFLGTILTFDRLLHEGEEYRVSPVVHDEKSTGDKHKRLLTYDPLENNVFWWHNKHSIGGRK